MTIQTPSTPGPPLAPIPYQPGPFPPAGHPAPGVSQHRGRWIALIVVVALIVVGAVTAIISGTGNESRPAAPTQVRATSVTATTATIAWTPAASTSPSLFRIYRNGQRIDAVGGHTYRFTDKGLAPARVYRYQVSAYEKGSWSNLSSAASVTTTRAPAGLARLFRTSQYSVLIKVTSEYGYTSIGAGDRSTETWWFNRRATSGQYTLLGNVSAGSFTMPISQHGRWFQGQTHETLSQCSYLPVNTEVRVTFQTVKTGIVDGVWGVTRFTGTLHHTAPATTVGLSRCPGAGYTATVTGHVVR